MEIRVEWNEPIDAIINRRVLRDGKTALFMAETWRRLYTPFVPRDQGPLYNDSVSVHSEGAKGYIHHNVPYARYIYYGHQLNFSKAKHHLAAAQWDMAAHKAGRSKALVSDTQAYIQGRNTVGR